MTKQSFWPTALKKFPENCKKFWRKKKASSRCFLPFMAKRKIFFLLFTLLWILWDLYTYRLYYKILNFTETSLTSRNAHVTLQTVNLTALHSSGNSLMTQLSITHYLSMYQLNMKKAKGNWSNYCKKMARTNPFLKIVKWKSLECRLSITKSVPFINSRLSIRMYNFYYLGSQKCAWNYWLIQRVSSWF